MAVKNIHRNIRKEYIKINIKMKDAECETAYGS